MINQTLMAGPLCILYEVGIICARLATRKRKASAARGTGVHPVSPMDFTALDLPEPVMRGIRDAGFVATTPIQEGTLPLGSQGQGRGGPVADGHGQDGGLPHRRLHALPAPSRPAPERSHRSPRAHHRSHARAGRPDRGRRAAPRRPHRAQDPRGVRRHRLQQAARGAERRLRHPRGHARASHRLSRSSTSGRPSASRSS